MPELLLLRSCSRKRFLQRMQVRAAADNLKRLVTDALV